MKQIRVRNDADGCPSVQVVDSDTNEVSQEIELERSQQVTVTVGSDDAAEVNFGTVETVGAPANPESAQAAEQPGTTPRDEADSPGETDDEEKDEF
jgi:hypothetical protein